MRKAALAAGMLFLAALAWRAARRAPPAPVSGDARAARQLAILREVLRSKNDDDSRLDVDLRDLSPEARRLFRAEYAALPREARNERGTIVFLLGRSSPTAEDWDFLRGVAGEEACLSLADCGRRGGPLGPGDAVTLAYPALVALKSAQRVLADASSGAAARKDARAVVSAGRASRAPAVARLAERVAAR